MGYKQKSLTSCEAFRGQEDLRFEPVYQGFRKYKSIPDNGKTQPETNPLIQVKIFDTSKILFTCFFCYDSISFIR